jgi:hypothetical protein
MQKPASGAHGTNRATSTVREGRAARFPQAVSKVALDITIDRGAALAFTPACARRPEKPALRFSCPFAGVLS